MQYVLFLVWLVIHLLFAVVTSVVVSFLACRWLGYFDGSFAECLVVLWEGIPALFH